MKRSPLVETQVAIQTITQEDMVAPEDPVVQEDQEHQYHEYHEEQKEIGRASCRERVLNLV